MILAFARLAPCRTRSLSWICGAILFIPWSGASAGELELRVVDEANGKPLAARVQLTDARGRHPRIRRGATFDDHFTVYGPTVLTLNGAYSYTIQAGPEYLEQSGSFVVKRDATDNHRVTLERFVDMKEKGWWSGDTWAQRDIKDATLLLAGEDLHLLGIPQQDFSEEDISPENSTVSATSNSGDQVFDSDALIQSSSGGRIHFWHWHDDVNNSRGLDAALDVDGATSTTKHIEIATPSAWDLPLWLATSRVDSILIHQPPMKTSSANPSGRPRDEVIFPGKYGGGRYHETIYHHILSSGLRIAPTATSASGVTQEAPGTHRTYVHLDGPFSSAAWWEALRAGRTMITNGPLIIASVNGEHPGHVFRAGDRISLLPKLTLHTKEKIDYLEFIKDGKTVQSVRLDDWVEAQGRLDPIDFDSSGWLIIRAVINHGDTYRYAATAPYYVEIGGQPRISRTSVQYFIDWVLDRAKQLKSTNDPQRESLLPHLRNAREFWQNRLDEANAP